MKRSIIITALIILLVGRVSVTTAQENINERQYVVMVSLDGFRWDYAEKANTPNLDRIASEGVMAASLIPCFPSKTFPNHYSIATGLHPGHHGIVMNNFYDETLDVHYSISNRDLVEDGRMYGGEPIWVTAEKQGVRSASFYWVGSEAAIGGIRPSYWKKYNHNFPYVQRIDTVIHWLSLPEDKRPGLVILYFDQPDGIGHDIGPYGEGIPQMVTYLDSLVGVLVSKIEALPHADRVNLIIVSDHGMGEISPEKTIYLSDHLKEGWIGMLKGGNPAFNLKAKDGYLDSVMTALESIEHLSVWRNGEAPEHLHYRDNPRITDMTILADSSWSVEWEQGSGYGNRGAHGYDPMNRDMHGIFYAFGPAFRKGWKHDSFQNIHIYVLLARILGIEPAATDGNPGEVTGMLKK